MILWDGSRHPWLEDRGSRLCLVAAIDDATGELLPGGHFVEQECTVGYLRVPCEIVKTKGIPLAAYMDRHGALQRNDKNWSLEEQLAGRRQPTQRATSGAEDAGGEEGRVRQGEREASRDATESLTC